MDHDHQLIVQCLQNLIFLNVCVKIMRFILGSLINIFMILVFLLLLLASRND